MTDEEIEEIILDEITVDCNSYEEVMMGWFYYFTENLKFPFKAEVELKNLAGQKALREVRVIGLAQNGNDFKNTEMPFEVIVEGVDLILEINIKFLQNIKGPEEVLQVFKIWNYWGFGG